MQLYNFIPDSYRDLKLLSFKKKSALNLLKHGLNLGKWVIFKFKVGRLNVIQNVQTWSFPSSGQVVGFLSNLNHNGIGSEKRFLCDVILCSE